MTYAEYKRKRVEVAEEVARQLQNEAMRQAQLLQTKLAQGAPKGTTL